MHPLIENPGPDPSETDRTGHKQQICDACSRDNEFISAYKWCKDCKEALCEPCCVAHRRGKLTSKHRIIFMEDVKEQEMLASKIEIDINCKSHRKEPLKLYCRNHKSFCCTLCAFTEHEECKKLIPIDDLILACTEKKLLEQQTAAFVEAGIKVRTAIDEKSSCLRSLEKDKLSILSKASDIVKKAKHELDHLYTNVVCELIKKHGQVKQSQEKYMQILEDFRSKIEENISTMQKLSHVSPQESVIMMETLKVETLQHHKNLETELNQNINERVTFKLDPTMKSIIDNLSSIGNVVKELYPVDCTIDVSSIKNVVDIGTIIGTQAQFPVVSTKDLMTAGVKLVKVVTVRDLGLKKTNNYNTSWFADGKFMKFNQLLLSDLENNRLVMLNEDMKVKRKIKVSCSPSCIYPSEDEMVVHVVCNRNSVHYYSLPGGEEVDSMMKLENDAWSICVTGYTTIIGHGCWGTNMKIALYDVMGNKIKSVTHRSTAPCVAVSNSGDQIYYSNGDNVVACDKELNVKWRYASGDLRGPRGICVDPYDNVYVVGKDSKNVHQISRDGARHRVLVQHMEKIRLPCAITFNNSEDVFVVTSFKEDIAFEVYEFSP